MKKHFGITLLLSGMFVLESVAQTTGTAPQTAGTPILEKVIETGLAGPYGVAAVSDDLYFITDSTAHVIYKYAYKEKALTIHAGRPGVYGMANQFGINARFYTPKGIVYSPALNGMVIADSGNHLIRYVSVDGLTLSNIAGIYNQPGGDNGSVAAAKFNSPSGLAIDAKGDIFVADTLNNAIRKIDTTTWTVSTVGTGFYRPSGVAVGDNGDLYVADTGNHSIKLIKGGVVSLIAGSDTRNLYGNRDSAFGAEALFSSPSGLLWGTNSFSNGKNFLLVSDTDNSRLREIKWDSVYKTYSVGTLAVSTNAAIFRPAGLGRSTLGDFIVDEGALKGALFRIPSVTIVLPDISMPQIGVIESNSSLDPISGSFNYNWGFNEIRDSVATFNNEPVVTARSTSSDDIGASIRYGINTTLDRNDSQTGSTWPGYNAFSPIQPGPSMLADHSTNIITLNVVGVAPNGSGRRNSQIKTVTFKFVVGEPAISDTVNMAGNIKISTITSNAVVRYSICKTNDLKAPTTPYYADGADKNGISVFDKSGRTSDDLVLIVEASREGYQTSYTTNTYYFRNIVATTMGFAGPSSGILAGPGSTVVVPVKLDLAPNMQVRSLQYRVELMPETPIAGFVPERDILFQFRPLEINSTNDFVVIPGSAGLDGNTSRFAYDVAYTVPNPNQLLDMSITYIGTDANFSVSDDAYVNLIAVPIPRSAINGQRFKLSILNPTATSDASQTDVFIKELAPTYITVRTNLYYLVGDTAPSQWYNATDPLDQQNSLTWGFGNGFLANNDVNNAFYASLGIRVPYNFSDVFDAMDVFPLDTTTTVGGDGRIRYQDWQVILQRSLGRDTNVWRRSWVAGGERKIKAAGVVGGESDSWAPTAVFMAGNASQAKPGLMVAVPIDVVVNPGAQVAGVQFRVSVTAENGAPAIQSPVKFVQDSALPAPTIVVSGLQDGLAVNEAAGAWALQSGLSKPIQGRQRLGFLQVVIPATATAGQYYTVHFANADGAADVYSQIDFDAKQGLIVVAAAAPADAAASVSDGWRLRYFGGLNNRWSDPNSDPNGDGVTNAEEFAKGTNPTRLSRLEAQRFAANRPAAGSEARITNGIKLRWFAALGKKYRVESSEKLNGSSWKEVVSNVIGRADLQELPIPAVGGNAVFFRVIEH